MRKNLLLGSVALVSIAIGMFSVFAYRRWSQVNRSPLAVSQAYTRAVYARDYATAWELISTGDREQKGREAYLSENISYSGLQQELAYMLADWIEFDDVETVIEGDNATVSVYVRVPNGNQPDAYALLNDAEEVPDGEAAPRQALREGLERMHSDGTLEYVEGVYSFELVRDSDGWGISLGWSHAIRVTLTAEVSDGLPWDFVALQTEVLALPGETLTVRYRAENLSSETVTAKAKHIVSPDALSENFITIQCFCFIQQTLAPGEVVEMPLVFRINPSVPDNVTAFQNHYVFYPIDKFPES